MKILDEKETTEFEITHPSNPFSDYNTNANNNVKSRSRSKNNIVTQLLRGEISLNEAQKKGMESLYKQRPQIYSPESEKKPIREVNPTEKDFIFESFNQRMEVHKQMKSAKLQSFINIREDKGLKECTFKPEITKS